MLVNPFFVVFFGVDGWLERTARLYPVTMWILSLIVVCAFSAQSPSTRRATPKGVLSCAPAFSHSSACRRGAASCVRSQARRRVGCDRGRRRFERSPHTNQ